MFLSSTEAKTGISFWNERTGSGNRIFLISREKQAADKEIFTVLGAKVDGVLLG